MLGRRLDGARDGIGIGLVEGRAPRPAPERLHRRTRLAGGVVALQIGDGDVGAGLRQGAGDSDTKSAGAAGHESDAILELHWVSSVRGPRVAGTCRGW